MTPEGSHGHRGTSVRGTGAAAPWGRPWLFGVPQAWVRVSAWLPPSCTTADRELAAHGALTFSSVKWGDSHHRCPAGCFSGLQWSSLCPPPPRPLCLPAPWLRPSCPRRLPGALLDKVPAPIKRAPTHFMDVLIKRPFPLDFTFASRAVPLFSPTRGPLPAKRRTFLWSVQHLDL